ncbi:MAG: NAD(P)/FAD-dependent oxidoreductase [Chitinophagaceae bacterium]|nr:MAG: NAD(P)/FAD-dependent oxidoreductase [Chitinophagaceae bacterium]
MAKTLVIIGGGAAGFFCAVTAKRLNPSLSVTILEKSSKVLSKVRISGGGRCNVTHACFSVTDMARRYPRGGNVVKKTFHQFFTTDTIEWFEERGVRLKAEPDGRMFPVTDSSETIIACFMREISLLGVSLQMNRDVQSLIRVGEQWHLSVSGHENIITDYVCIACGGFPKESAFDWIKAVGHSVETPVPSLFTFNMPGNPITQLMGVSVGHAGIRISDSKLQESGPLLITHWGMSGPAVLKLSAWGARELAALNYNFEVIVNWVPGEKEPAVRETLQGLRQSTASQKVFGRNPFALPNRLWEYLLALSEIRPQWKWGDLPNAHLNTLVRHLASQKFQVKGKTTFKEEFVTAGGVRTTEIDANTMESKLQPGLFFAGEIMNVDGVTGGFNFQHAWTSGYIVGKIVAELAS